MVGTSTIWIRLKGTFEELYQKLSPDTYRKSKLSNQPEPAPGNLLKTPEIYPKAEDVVLAAVKKSIAPYDVEKIEIDPKSSIIVVTPKDSGTTEEIIEQVNISPYSKIFKAEKGLTPEDYRLLEEKNIGGMWS